MFLSLERFGIVMAQEWMESYRERKSISTERDEHGAEQRLALAESAAAALLAFTCRCALALSLNNDKRRPLQPAPAQQSSPLLPLLRIATSAPSHFISPNTGSTSSHKAPLTSASASQQRHRTFNSFDDLFGLISITYS